MIVIYYCCDKILDPTFPIMQLDIVSFLRAPVPQRVLVLQVWSWMTMGPAVDEGRLAPASLYAITLNSYSSPSVRSSTLNLVVSTSLLLHLKATAQTGRSAAVNTHPPATPQC